MTELPANIARYLFSIFVALLIGIQIMQRGKGHTSIFKGIIEDERAIR
jgi:hypothetical protein